MKKMKKRLIKDDRGAALLAVLIAIIFVSTIATLVTAITVTNINMKEVERASKVNFYSAEEVLDELTLKLNDKAAAAMQTAYTEVLQDYTTYAAMTSAERKEEFGRLYLKQLEDIFYDSTNSANNTYRYQKQKDFTSRLIYVSGSYKVSELKACLDSSAQGYLQIEDGLSTDPASGTVSYDHSIDKAIYICDYGTGRFTLQNVRIIYTDANGYETELTTDIVFSTPDLSFDGSNLMKDFMDYALIADTGININQQSTTINGSVYAGSEGIYTSNGSWVESAVSKIVGKMIVSRGTLLVSSGTNLQVGDADSELWVENIETTGKGSASTLTLNGTSYVSDDLTLNGKGSTVYVNGKYYGYNFQENYTAVSTTNSNADFSSAMLINGQGASLNLTGVDRLVLSGTSFISRGASNENNDNIDILLGESVSLRTNQLTYLVPTDYVDQANVTFAAGGLSAYSAKLGFDPSSYLNSLHPLTAYYYWDSTMNNMGVSETIVQYYLNFKSVSAAEEFFNQCFNGSAGSSIRTNAEEFSGNAAVIVDDLSIMTLKGDMMYKTSAAESYQLQKGAALTAEWNQNMAYWTFADSCAKKYKALQLYLEESQADSITSSSVRFYKETAEGSGVYVIDETKDSTLAKENRLFDNLIDRAILEVCIDENDGTDKDDDGVASSNGVVLKKTEIPGTSNQYQVVVLSKGDYTISDRFVKGVVICEGNVAVSGNFEGMIIAGGTVSFQNINTTVTGNQLLVSSIFSEDMNAGESGLGFTECFKTYNVLSEDMIGNVLLDHYTTYENWSKTEE